MNAIEPLNRKVRGSQLRRDQHFRDSLTETRDRLRRVTESCRADMHEPDEQGIQARVFGYRLDNAYGDSIRMESLTRGSQEFVVVLENRYTEEFERFNLADLIALARMAVIK